MTEVMTRRDRAVADRSTFIARLIPQIARAAPKHMDADRIARIALTLVRVNPTLAECSEESFAGALLTASAYGLEPGLGEAHLVPYGKECTFIPDYKGIAKLFWQHPLAAHLECEAVHEKDQFDYAYGSDAFLRFRKARGDRGPITDYYALAKLTSGAVSFVVLSPDDVKELRQGKVGPDPRFKGGDPQHWMERKTVLKQLFKLIPKSVQLQRALESDEKSGRDLYAERVQETVVAQQVIEAAPEPPPVDEQTGEIGWPEVAEVPQ